MVFLVYLSSLLTIPRPSAPGDTTVRRDWHDILNMLPSLGHGKAVGIFCVGGSGNRDRSTVPVRVPCRFLPNRERFALPKPHTLQAQTIRLFLLISMDPTNDMFNQDAVLRGCSFGPAAGDGRCSG